MTNSNNNSHEEFRETITPTLSIMTTTTADSVNKDIAPLLQQNGMEKKNNTQLWLTNRMVRDSTDSEYSLQKEAVDEQVSSIRRAVSPLIQQQQQNCLSPMEKTNTYSPSSNNANSSLTITNINPTIATTSFDAIQVSVDMIKEQHREEEEDKEEQGVNGKCSEPSESLERLQSMLAFGGGVGEPVESDNCREIDADGPPAKKRKIEQNKEQKDISHGDDRVNKHPPVISVQTPEVVPLPRPRYLPKEQLDLFRPSRTGKNNTKHHTESHHINTCDTLCSLSSSSSNSDCTTPCVEEKQLLCKPAVRLTTIVQVLVRQKHDRFAALHLYWLHLATEVKNLYISNNPRHLFHLYYSLVFSPKASQSLCQLDLIFIRHVVARYHLLIEKSNSSNNIDQMRSLSDVHWKMGRSGARLSSFVEYVEQRSLNNGDTNCILFCFAPSYDALYSASYLKQHEDEVKDILQAIPTINLNSPLIRSINSSQEAIETSYKAYRQWAKASPPKSIEVTHSSLSELTSTIAQVSQKPGANSEKVAKATMSQNSAPTQCSDRSINFPPPSVTVIGSHPSRISASKPTVPLHATPMIISSSAPLGEQTHRMITTPPSPTQTTIWKSCSSSSQQPSNLPRMKFQTPLAIQQQHHRVHQAQQHIYQRGQHVPPQQRQPISIEGRPQLNVSRSVLPYSTSRAAQQQFAGQTQCPNRVVTIPSSTMQEHDFHQHMQRLQQSSMISHRQQVQSHLPQYTKADIREHVRRAFVMPQSIPMPTNNRPPTSAPPQYSTSSSKNSWLPEHVIPVTNLPGQPVFIQPGKNSPMFLQNTVVNSSPNHFLNTARQH